jgi:hypothetical protein
LKIIIFHHFHQKAKIFFLILVASSGKDILGAHRRRRRRCSMAAAAAAAAPQAVHGELLQPLHRRKKRHHVPVRVRKSRERASPPPLAWLEDNPAAQVPELRPAKLRRPFVCLRKFATRGSSRHIRSVAYMRHSPCIGAQPPPPPHGRRRCCLAAAGGMSRGSATRRHCPREGVDLRALEGTGHCRGHTNWTESSSNNTNAQGRRNLFSVAAAA